MLVSYICAISDEARCTQVQHAARLLPVSSLNILPASVPGFHAVFYSSDIPPDIDLLLEKLRCDLSLAGNETYGIIIIDQSIILSANSQYGLASGLYALHRQFTSGLDIQAGISAPAFEFRDVYHFLTPWRMRGLSADSMWYEEWTEHIDNIRRLGANRLYIDFWADQYYHPDYPETNANVPLWELLRKVFEYAHSVGLRTGVVTFPHQVPAWLYDRNPDSRATEAVNYHGIHLCWSKAQEKIKPFDQFIFEFFGSSLDDAIVEFQDPGLCFCKECCERLPEIVIQTMDLYRSWMGNDQNRRLDLCTLHFRDWIEDPRSDSRIDHPVVGLRKKVFSQLSKNTIIFDIDSDTMEIAKSFGLKTSHFFFDLDPESGIPDETVFPRPKLTRIHEQINICQKNGTNGVLDYRLMPRTQFLADELVLRKCWETDLTVDKIITDLAAQLGVAASKRSAFHAAVGALEDYWNTGQPSSIIEASEFFSSLPKSHDKITRLADLTAVLAILAPHIANTAQETELNTFYPDAELVEQVYQRMRSSRIFNAFTIDMHWEIRAREMIGMHIRWWMRGIAASFRRKDDGATAW